MYSLGVWVALLACVSVCSGSKIIGYWGAYPGGIQSTVPQLSAAISEGYNVIIYAFYDVDAAGALTQDPGAYPAPTKAAINSTKSFSYLASLFGGQNGKAPNLVLTPNAWAQAMYNNFVALHNSHGFDGIDIDLENAWGTTPNVVICGLRAFFKLMHTNGYIVSMAPQTTAVLPGIPYVPASWNSYAPLIDSSIVQYVDILAVQLYNNAVPGNDIAGYASSLEEGFQVTGCPDCGDGGTCFVQVPNCKIAFGYPSSLGAAPAGCPGLSYASSDKCPYGATLANVYTNAVLKGTAGVMTWSIEYDQGASWQFVKAASSVPFSTTCTKPSTIASTSASTGVKTTATTSQSTATTKSGTTSSTSTSTLAQSTSSKPNSQVTGAGARFIGYWGSNPGALTSSLTQLQTALTKGYNVLVYTYYGVDASGGIHVASGSAQTPVKSSIATTSFVYLVSLFGSSGVAPTLTLSSDAWAQALYKSFVILHESFGFDGVDIQLQGFAGAWGTTSENLICGLRAFFKLMHTNGYLVSLSPQTSALYPQAPAYATASWNSYAPLVDSSIIDFVDIVAVQMYGGLPLAFSDPVQFTNSLVDGFKVTNCPNCTGSTTGLVQIPPCKLAYAWPATKGASSSGCAGLKLSSDGCPYGDLLASLYGGSSVLTSTSGVTTWSIEWDASVNWPFIASATSVKFATCKPATSNDGSNIGDAIKNSASHFTPSFLSFTLLLPALLFL